MFKSFLCSLFGCGYKTKIFSAKIEANQGRINPAQISEINGWTVWKMDQIELYIVKHNLGLTDPERQMHIVATPELPDTFLTITSVESNQFTVYTWGPNSALKDSAFMFIAALRS